MSILITTWKKFSARISVTSTFTEAQRWNNSPYFSIELFILIHRNINLVCAVSY